MVELWNEFVTSYNHEIMNVMEYGGAITLLVIFIILAISSVVGYRRYEKLREKCAIDAYEYLKNKGRTVTMIKDKPYVFNNGKWNKL